MSPFRVPRGDWRTSTAAAAVLALASACSAPDGQATPASPAVTGEGGAAASSPGSETTLAGAMAHLARGEMEEAVAQLRLMRDAHPQDPYAHFYLGRALHLDTKLGEAEAAYLKALDRAPGLVEAWGHLYAIRMEQGRHEEALAALEALEAKQGAGPRLAYQKGHVLSRMARFDEADRWFTASLAALPGNPDAWYGLGMNAVRRGDDARGVEAFRRALQVDASYSDAWFNLGNALARLGRSREAEEALARFAAVNAKREEEKARQARLNALRSGAEMDLVRGRLPEARRQIEAMREAGDEAGAAAVEDGARERLATGEARP